MRMGFIVVLMRIVVNTQSGFSPFPLAGPEFVFYIWKRNCDSERVGQAMTRMKAEQGTMAPDAAFAAVLAAEREAQAAVAACAAEAGEVRTAAEAAVRTLAERAVARRVAWRERHAAAVASQVVALRCEAEAAAGPVALDAAAQTRLAAAVVRLAEELGGGAGEAG